mmetsp:Transcript_27851/g.50464  ORF Transcript_27851/g.50464 Transcript_27851/m.50464 type:complete len:118 (+) Transcript_27851:326-679(+)
MAGRLALHRAAIKTKTAPMDILRQLIEVHTDALVAQGNDGFTPLHCLCRLQHGNTTLDELRLFIQKNPIALQIRDKKRSPRAPGGLAGLRKGGNGLVFDSRTCTVQYRGICGTRQQW